MVADSQLVGVNITEEKLNPNSTMFRCCSGSVSHSVPLCIVSLT